MRLRYIDYTKGLAIILMLFGHTMTKINFVHIWIYSFHMPVFFVIGGILMYRKETRREFGDFVRSNIFADFGQQLCHIMFSEVCLQCFIHY